MPKDNLNENPNILKWDAYLSTWQMHCPVCEDTIVEQMGPGPDTEASAVTVAPDRDEYDSPIGTRGGFTRIELFCPVGHGFDLIIANHKGSQFIGVVLVGERNYESVERERVRRVLAEAESREMPTTPILEAPRGPGEAKMPPCEACGQEPATSLSWFGDPAVREPSGTWKFTGKCTTATEAYYILLEGAGGWLDREVRHPSADRSTRQEWIETLSWKPWFDLADFQAMLQRFEKARAELANLDAHLPALGKLKPPTTGSNVTPPPGARLEAEVAELRARVEKLERAR